MIHVNGTPLLNALFCAEFVPVVSLVIAACVGYRFPVKFPTRSLSLKRWARLTFSRLNTTARVYYPADVLFFHLGNLQRRKSDDRGI